MAFTCLPTRTETTRRVNVGGAVNADRSLAGCVERRLKSTVSSSTGSIRRSWSRLTSRRSREPSFVLTRAGDTGQIDPGSRTIERHGACGGARRPVGRWARDNGRTPVARAADALRYKARWVRTVVMIRVDSTVFGSQRTRMTRNAVPFCWPTPARASVRWRAPSVTSSARAASVPRTSSERRRFAARLRWRTA